MKKLLAVLLAALLLAAPAFAQTASLAGEWTMTKTVASGVVMSPEAYGLSMTIVLNPDGTAFARQTINGAPMEENGTWTQAGNTVTITSQLTGEVSTFTLQADGTLLAMADGVAIAHDALCGGCDNLSQAHNNQYSKDTFGAWCESIGIHRKAAERLLQVSKLMDNSTPREQKVLEELTPSVLYEASRPSAEPEAVEALKSKQVKTLKEFRALEAQLKAEREAREKAEHETELERKEREDAHAAALRYKAEADRRAQDQNRLEGLVQTVTHERDGARQALAAAKLRGDKLKEENDALREQPIRGDFADADEIDRRAQEKAEAMTAEYRDQIAELQDRAETGDANACYDQVILASRALENAWTLAKSAYKRLPAGMRAYPREMLHNAFAKFEEELKCL